jgi:hypothetical protein
LYWPLQFIVVNSPVQVLSACPVCTENSIQLETKGIQLGGVLPKNLGCMILGRSVDPSWRMTPAKFALFSGESSFRYTQGFLQGLPVRLDLAVHWVAPCLATLGSGNVTKLLYGTITTQIGVSSWMDSIWRLPLVKNMHPVTFCRFCRLPPPPYFFIYDINQRGNA